jgi:hypothetical protein
VAGTDAGVAAPRARDIVGKRHWLNYVFLVMDAKVDQTGNLLQSAQVRRLSLLGSTCESADKVERGRSLSAYGS